VQVFITFHVFKEKCMFITYAKQERKRRVDIVGYLIKYVISSPKKLALDKEKKVLKINSEVRSLAKKEPKMRPEGGENQVGR